MTAIDDFLGDYSRAWAALCTDGIADFWSPADFVHYKAEEVETLLTDWDDLLAYWTGNERLHAAVALTFSDTRSTPLGADHYVATARMHWNIAFREDASFADGSLFPHRGRAMAGVNHVVMQLCGHPSHIRLRGWVEAPDAPLTYLRRLYLREGETPGASA
jgi:hypothetical protein